MITRRDFMKKTGLLMFGMVACGITKGQNLNISKKIGFPTQTPTLAPTNTPTPHQITRKQELITKYGRALTVPAFEYHGDNYSMFEDCYNMNPETFAKQMRWLQENDYYAVTAIDLQGFVDGTEDLPGRSVILTTDSGNTSLKSIPRMIDVLQETNMHFNSFIWTKDMDADESNRCKNNICWDTFKKASNSGVFSIGSHTESHRDFGSLEPQEGIEELALSKKKIEDNIGREVISISWPYEVCPYYADSLTDMGYQYAFGGRSKPLLYCSVEKGDLLRWCLPRILPPNINGKSGRPSGLSLEEILVKFNKVEF